MALFFIILMKTLLLTKDFYKILFLGFLQKPFCLLRILTKSFSMVLMEIFLLIKDSYQILFYSSYENLLWLLMVLAKSFSRVLVKTSMKGFRKIPKKVPSQRQNVNPWKTFLRTLFSNSVFTGRILINIENPRL